jgi:hypothetical protein
LLIQIDTNFINFGVIAIEMNLVSFNYLENISLLVQILKLLKYKQMSYSNSSQFSGFKTRIICLKQVLKEEVLIG